MRFSVLMVCTGNICRSPMAEGLLRQHLPEHLKDKVSVTSAGTHGLHGNRAEPLAIRAAAVHGADIRDHRARALDMKMVKAVDLVLAMEAFHIKQINRLFLFRCKNARLLRSFLTPPANSDIQDPYGQDYPAYEETAQSILDCLPGLIAHIQNHISETAK